MKILIIDDDQASIFLTKLILSFEGFSQNVEAFHDSDEALKHLLNAESDEIPEIILLDLNMPVYSGWDILDAIAPFEEKFKDRCNIYILTSSLDTTDMVKSKSYSTVSGFIHKPITNEDINMITSPN